MPTDTRNVFVFDGLSMRDVEAIAAEIAPHAAGEYRNNLMRAAQAGARRAIERERRIQRAKGERT